MGWWHLTRKDLRLLIRDRRAFAILLLLPLIFISIVGLSTGKLLGWRADNQVVKVAWVDRDGGDLAKRLREKLDQRDEVEVVNYSDHLAAERDVFDGKCTLAMTIGPEFQRRIDALQLRDFFARHKGKGKLAAGLSSLDITVDTKASWHWVSQLVSDTLYSLTLEDVFPVIAKKHNLGRVLINNMEAAAEEDDSASGNAADNSSAITELPAPPIKRLTSAEPKPGSQAAISESKSSKNTVYDTLVPGFTVMFTFFLVNVMARSFIAERDLGTLRRLRLAPITSIGLLVGKTLPFFLISLLQSVALFIFGRVLFDMSWGDRPWLLLPIIACTSLAATSLGLLVATSVRTESQVSSYANLIVISLAGVSGCFLPRDWMPELMKQISLATPHAWSLIAYGEALSNPSPSLAPVATSCLWLCVFSAVFFTAGVQRFRSLR